jgi:plastocyanin
MKKLALVMIIALALTWLISCDSISTTVTSNNPNTVKMEGGTFNISSITISKGSTITFLDDPNNGALHILVVGQDGQQNSEQGATDFGGLSGQRVDIGSTWTTPPWNTAGTYHVTCTVHPLMNLTVKVTG